MRNFDFLDKPGIKGIGLAALAVVVGGVLHERRAGNKAASGQGEGGPNLLPKFMQLDEGRKLVGAAAFAGHGREALLDHEPEAPWGIDKLDIPAMDRVGISDWREQMRECLPKLRHKHHVGMVVKGESLKQCGVDNGRIALIQPLFTNSGGTRNISFNPNDVVLVASSCGKSAVLRQLRTRVDEHRWETCCAEKCIILHENIFVGRLDCPTASPCPYQHQSTP